MKKLFAVSLLILSSLVSAQELHTFSNGEVADAEKINENFENLKNQLGEITTLIPGDQTVDTDLTGYLIVNVDCNETADALLSAHFKYRSEPQVRYRVTGSCDAELVDGVGTVLPIQIIAQTVIIEPGDTTSSICPIESAQITNEISVSNGSLEINCVKVGSLRSSVGAIGLTNSEVDEIQGVSSVVRIRSLRGSSTNINLKDNSQLYIEAGIYGASLNVTLNQSSGVLVLERFVNSEVTLQGSSVLRCALCFGDVKQFYLGNGSRAEINSNENVQAFLSQVGLPLSWDYLNVARVSLRPNSYFDYGALTPTEIAETVRYPAHSSEDFQPVSLANIPASCSAVQDGSSVVITCADGTSGVLASEGTVVVYPEGGIVGESPVQSWPTGEIVWADATDLVLGKATTTPNEILLDGYKAGVKNDHDENISYITSHGASTDIKLLFLTEDCSGQGFVQYGQRNRLVFADGIYVADTTTEKEQLLTKSYIRAEGFWVVSSFNRDISCKTKEYTFEVLPLIGYQLAPELQELAYPVSKVQLP